MPQFHETEMGRRFYERDVPEIADALKSIATALEKITSDDFFVDHRQSLTTLEHLTDLTQAIRKLAK